MNMQSVDRAASPRNEPIAIIGLGCRFPGDADDPASFWDLLCAGVDTISEVPASRWNVDQYFNVTPGVPGKTYSKWGGFVKEIDAFDPESFGISPREATRMDPQQRMLLEVSWEALEDAGLPLTSIAGTGVGVFIGISTTDYASLQTGPRVDGYTATGGAASISANRIFLLVEQLGAKHRGGHGMLFGSGGYTPGLPEPLDARMRSCPRRRRQRHPVSRPVHCILRRPHVVAGGAVQGL